ncbi:prephenate dehydratase [Enterococcus hulanensis]|uniref:Prephenate dehydratase n=1 Tax=Enterococcus hulanensis TaxID=2559929 RepID=A0ABU3EY25_9ENTE|nr:prephenate dehydratase [Enterococcus hulanensis]MDT2599771.1 prephenate dehydratase [Enterococcus hulanensis]MDT2609373.1 prephenate dehydratase [Enterococcus hulanensis]MDT2615950.1 prephenate dehydratase [Enterococcus hulanensis]MDT2628010.1 prephenate dehydratase [Enterococcus hulanensis]MDT2655115.1 prephenate dehydratase [Enterococcus hulanensis]
MKVGYLGPRGSFTYSAAANFFNENVLLPYDSLTALLEEQRKGALDYCVVPIENTIEGSVLPTLDLIFQTLPTIQAEIVLPIQQQLMVHPAHADSWQDTELICSHQQALAQSQVFLMNHFPTVDIEQIGSTAQGAQKVADNPDKRYAAIGSRDAAKQFGLTIVQENIQSISENETRFWVLGEQPVAGNLPHGKNKATVLFDLASDHPGALYQGLAIFAAEDINLTKIESRTQKTKLGEYFFIIDLETPAKEKLNKVLLQLKEQNFAVTLIGDYPTYLPAVRKS